MKPSTRVKAAATGLVLLLFASLHFALPALSALFSRIKADMPHAEGKYVVAYAPTQEQAGEYQRIADDFVSGYLRRWEKSRGAKAPGSRADLWMFPDRGALSRHSLGRYGNALENNGGYFSVTENAVCLVQNDTRGINHELTHMLQHSSWGSGLSSWFAEGHAQWHESGTEGSPGIGVAQAREKIRSWRSLREIIEADHGSFSGSDNSVFYAQAASLFAWLSEDQEVFTKVLQLEIQGRGSDLDAFCGALGKSASQIEKEWKDWAEK